MKNIITLSIFILFSSILYGQQDTIKNYKMEVWDAEILNNNGYNAIKLSFYNLGSPYKNPIIQISYKDIVIANVEKKAEECVILRNSLHKIELPIEIPNDYDSKKIKLDVFITNGEHSMNEKVKVIVNP